MRISDWSSDVCSADLETVLLVLFVFLFAWIVQAFVGALAGFVLIVSRRRARLNLSGRAPKPVLVSRTALLMTTYNEIGSASCIGGVCTYVLLRVAAVPLQTQTNSTQEIRVRSL